MKFGEMPLAEARARSSRTASSSARPRSRKARVLSPADVELIAAAGVSRVVVARLEAGDVGENAAAERVAAAAAGSRDQSPAAPFTGRANLYAEARGLLVFDPRARRPAQPRRRGDHPRRRCRRSRRSSRGRWSRPSRSSRSPAPERAVEECAAAASRGGPLLRVAPFRPLLGRPASRPGCRGSRKSILDKTREVTEARLSALGCKLVCEARCAHDDRGVGGADRRGARPWHRPPADPRRLGDPRPARRDPGRDRGRRRPDRPFRHAGRSRQSVAARAMSAGVPVLGLPGCARSPKVNGFDWVLERLRRRTAGRRRRRSCGWAAAACWPRSRRGRCRAPKQSRRRPRQKPPGPRIGAAAARRRPVAADGRAQQALGSRSESSPRPARRWWRGSRSACWRRAPGRSSP